MVYWMKRELPELVEQQTGLLQNLITKVLQTLFIIYVLKKLIFHHQAQAQAQVVQALHLVQVVLALAPLVVLIMIILMIHTGVLIRVLGIQQTLNGCLSMLEQ